MIDASFYRNRFDEQINENKRFRPGNSEYGGNVMPILQMYKNLSNYEERKCFQEALESFLVDKNEDRRKFAVDVCLGFVVFKDVI